MNVTNHSVLHVYFPNSGTEFLKQDVTTRWYEYLGKYTYYLPHISTKTYNEYISSNYCMSCYHCFKIYYRNFKRYRL